MATFSTTEYLNAPTIFTFKFQGLVTQKLKKRYKWNTLSAIYQYNWK